MLGMFALGVSFLYGVAVAAAIAVAFTVIAALTLLPALLGLLRHAGAAPPRAPRARARQSSGRATSRRLGTLGDGSRARPAMFAAVASLIVIILALPFLLDAAGLRRRRHRPASTTTRKAYDLLAKGFGPGYNGPLQLVAQVRSRPQKAAFTRSIAQVAKTPGVVGSTPAGRHPSSPRQADGRGRRRLPVGLAAGRIDHGAAAPPPRHGDPGGDQGHRADVLVGGTTAIFEDFANVLSGKLPLFIGIVVVLSFLLLMLVFRSLLIPLTAAVMNLLSAGGRVRRADRRLPGRVGDSADRDRQDRPDRVVHPGAACSRSCSASRWTTRCS